MNPQTSLQHAAHFRQQEIQSIQEGGIAIQWQAVSSWPQSFPGVKRRDWLALEHGAEDPRFNLPVNVHIISISPSTEVVVKGVVAESNLVLVCLSSKSIRRSLLHLHRHFHLNPSVRPESHSPLQQRQPRYIQTQGQSWQSRKSQPSSRCPAHLPSWHM